MGKKNVMCKKGSNGIRDRGPGNVYGLILDGIGLEYWVICTGKGWGLGIWGEYRLNTNENSLV